MNNFPVKTGTACEDMDITAAKRHRSQIVVFGLLTDDDKSMHLLLDEVFWLQYFKSNKIRATLVTSEFSRHKILRDCPDLASSIKMFPDYLKQFLSLNRLSLIERVFTAPRPRNSLVLVQGFEEVSLLIFLMINMFRNNKYILVLTNNISQDRLIRGGVALRLLLRLIFKRCHFVFCHSEFERELIYKYIKPRNINSIVKIKYHLMIAHYTKPKTSFNKRIISFYGPLKLGKPIDDFVKLIRADTQKKFFYKIYNSGKNLEKGLIDDLRSRSNVQIIDKFMEYETYLQTVQESSYIFLPHDLAFEGKLSGNLCDCITNLVPFISNKIHPIIEFTQQYGDLGYMYDFQKDHDWPNYFLQYEAEETREIFVSNLIRMREEYSFSKIKTEIDGYLLPLFG
ncbi:MAG: hypothetical protein H3C28_01320 [Sphingomonadales bacterium]|nr:hypothetical protein [Sphingomonadales bacterium]